MRIYELDKKERRKNDKDITGYDEIRKKKTDPDSEIDSVVAHLKGHRSAYFTKLARRFSRATRIKKLLAAEEKSLKADALGAVEAIFDKSDEVYTRVVETASLVFKIAKSGDKTINKLDQAGYLAELEELTGLALNELQTIKDKYTKPVTTKVVPKVLAPREKKPAKKEAMYEGVIDNIGRFIASAGRQIDSFLANWDSKFNNLKSKIEAEL